MQAERYQPTFAQSEVRVGVLCVEIGRFQPVPARLRRDSASQGSSPEERRILRRKWPAEVYDLQQETNRGSQT